jgi:hypothetical protein
LIVFFNVDHGLFGKIIEVETTTLIEEFALFIKP